MTISMVSGVFSHRPARVPDEVRRRNVGFATAVRGTKEGGDAQEDGARDFVRDRRPDTSPDQPEERPYPRPRRGYLLLGATPGVPPTEGVNDQAPDESAGPAAQARGEGGV